MTRAHHLPLVAATAAAIVLAAVGMSACGSEASSAPRRVGVTMVDHGFVIEGDLDSVAVDDVIVFMFENTGTVQHEAVIGDAMFQQGHTDHQHLPGMVMPGAVMVQPGETVELSYRFMVPGTILIACHEPGHYEAGMVREITVG